MGWPFGTKKGNLLLFDAGQAGRVLAESWAEFTTESLSRVLAEEKHRSHDAEWVRGGRRPDAVRQCTRAGSIFFLFYFQEGSLGIFFYYNPPGGVFFFYYLWTQHCTTLTVLTSHPHDFPLVAMWDLAHTHNLTTLSLIMLADVSCKPLSCSDTADTIPSSWPTRLSLYKTPWLSHHVS